MNRNQRRFSRIPSRREKDEMEEIFPPKEKKSTGLKAKGMANRSCYICPMQEDFGQFTSNKNSPVPSSHMTKRKQFNNLILDQYGFDLSMPGAIERLSELRQLLCGNGKVENSCQYTSPRPISPTRDDVDGSHWQNVESVDEIDQYIDDMDCVDGRQSPFLSAKTSEKSIKSKIDMKNVSISEVPRVKIIAEKYTKYKKNNIELRKLDEKVVCVEYDIFHKIVKGELSAPVQKMRLFFSIKPSSGTDGSKEAYNKIPARNIPSNIKRKFNISDSDLQKLNLKEIEIIDAKIAENKPYLDDLKTVLKRKKAFYTKKNKSTLDLLSLYEIAKRKQPICDHYNSTNILSQAELEEVKDLILKKSCSSIHGINRRTVKCVLDKDNIETDMKVISESIVTELLRG